MDAITNWPEPRNKNRPLYNAVVEVTRVSASEAVEPVTLEEIKAHMKIDFSDEDDFLQDVLRPACRRTVENYTGVAMIRSDVTAVLKNEIGGIELPYGPIVDISPTGNLLEDLNGDPIDGSTYHVDGVQFLTIREPFADNVYATYQSGYEPEDIPQDLKYALLEEIAFRYHNRGSAEKISPMAKGFADKHRRSTWLL